MSNCFSSIYIDLRNQITQIRGEANSRFEVNFSHLMDFTANSSKKGYLFLWHLNSYKIDELVIERSIVSSKCFSQTGCSFSGTEIIPEKPDPGNAGGGRREKIQKTFL